MKPVPLLITVLALTGLLVPAAGSRPSVFPTLYVDYTINCTFTISDDSDRRVSTIPPGTYQVQIQTPVAFGSVDLTGVHDMTACQSFVQFQLSGPGVNLSSTLGDGDSAFWLYTETFQPGGTYTAVDNNQPSVARVVFSAATSGSASTSGGTSTTSSSSTTKGSTQQSLVGSQASPFRGSLDGILLETGIAAYIDWLRTNPQ